MAEEKKTKKKELSNEVLLDNHKYDRRIAQEQAEKRRLETARKKTYDLTSCFRLLSEKVKKFTATRNEVKNKSQDRRQTALGEIEKDYAKDLVKLQEVRDAAFAVVDKAHKKVCDETTEVFQKAMVSPNDEYEAMKLKVEKEFEESIKKLNDAEQVLMVEHSEQIKKLEELVKEEKAKKKAEKKAEPEQEAAAPA